MKRPFDSLLANLEKSLNNLDRDLAGVDRYGRAIGLIRDSLLELRGLGTKFITGRDTEIAFFREAWPAFFGKLLLYVQLHQFEIQRRVTSAEGMAELISQEGDRVATFFSFNREFWMHYRSGSPALDEQFTRAFSRANVFDPLGLAIDAEGATPASYRAAKGLAYEQYLVFLQQQKSGIGGTNRRRLEWKESKSAAVELIKSQAEAGSIYVDGQPATTVQLKEDFEERYGCDLKDFDILLHVSDTRKKDPTPYLTKLVRLFTRRRERLNR